MEFIKNNARGLIVALLAVGVITAISASSNNDQSDSGADVSQTATDSEQGQGPLAPEADDTQEPDTDSNQNNEESSAFNEAGERENAPVDTTDDSYATTARIGDNQTTLVRDIISQYKDGEDSVLSAEQMLYVETNLVNNLPKNDLIYAGEKVQLAKAEIESTVSAAKDLSEAELALWANYL